MTETGTGMTLADVRSLANAIRAAICPAILVSVLSMASSNPDAFSGHTTAASTAAPRKVRGTTPGNSW